MSGQIEEAAGIIECFAEACERLNAYARALSKHGPFSKIGTGADIRKYESGWRLEKHVEAEICAEKGNWACWWLELGVKDKLWIVSSSVSVSQSDSYYDFDDRHASSLGELKTCLAAAITELESALDLHDEFREDVEVVQKQ